jgi:aspartate dehydrogenase
MKTVGLIGCGAIGTLIAEAAAKRLVMCDELLLLDYDFEKAEKLKSVLNFPTTVVLNIEEMIKLRPIVVVEAASQQAVREYAGRIIAEDIDLIVMSTGALVGLNIRKNRIHIPSGAIGGLDALSSAALAGINEVVLTTKKNPSLFNMNNSEQKVVYEGNAQEAAKLFPREMNVAATLAVTVRPLGVKVRLISDPEVTRNTHEIYVIWRYGEMLMKFENDPHPENPHTSALAAWSAIKLLQTLLDK